MNLSRLSTRNIEILNGVTINNPTLNVTIDDIPEVVIDDTVPLNVNITNAVVPISAGVPLDVNILSPNPLPTVLSGSSTVIVEPGVDTLKVEQALPVLIDSTIPVDVNISSQTNSINVTAPSFIQMYNDPVYQRYSQTTEFGSFDGSGIDNLPSDHTVSVFEPFYNDNSQVNISSDNAADTSRTIVVRGYSQTGVPIKEEIMTDAVDGRTPVTTVNSFCNITEVAILAESIPLVAGTIWVYRTSQIPVSGVPARYVSKVIGGNRQHNSFQPMLHAPINKNVLINKLTIKEIGEVDNKEDHQIELVTTNSGNNQVYNTFDNIQYIKSFSKLPRTYENIVVPYNGSSAEGMLLGFMVESTGEDLDAQIEITFDYSFY